MSRLPLRALCAAVALLSFALAFAFMIGTSRSTASMGSPRPVPPPAVVLASMGSPRPVPPPAVVLASMGSPRPVPPPAVVLASMGSPRPVPPPAAAV